MRDGGRGIEARPILLTAGGPAFQGQGRYAKSYTLHIPAKPPAEQFWSIAVYSWDTRTLIDNDQKRSAQSSRQDLVMNDDGSVDLYYGPTAPKGKEKNWVQTIPGQGWWVYLRFYAPTKAYFDKTWSMGDFEKIR